MTGPRESKLPPFVALDGQSEDGRRRFTCRSPKHPYACAYVERTGPRAIECPRCQIADMEAAELRPGGDAA